MVTESMTVPERSSPDQLRGVERVAPERDTRARPRRRRWTIALVAVVLVAAGLGGWLIANDNQSGDAPQTVVVVQAFMNAAVAGDSAALEQTVTPDVVYTWLWRDHMVIDPITGADVAEYFLTVQHSLDPAAPLFEPLGEPVALGEFQVAVPNHMELNRYDGVLVYTLNRKSGDLKITEIYWIPEQDGIWHSE